MYKTGMLSCAVISLICSNTSKTTTRVYSRLALFWLKDASSKTAFYIFKRAHFSYPKHVSKITKYRIKSCFGLYKDTV